MNLGDYPTPGDVKLYIDDLWVDDAYRVDFEEQNKKIPLYGYHQKYFADVADGKVIIVGNIIIHYRFPGYLNHAIQRVLVQREKGEVQDKAVVQPGVVPGSAPSASVPAERRAPNRAGGDIYSVKAAIDYVRRNSRTPFSLVKALKEASQLGNFDVYSAILEEMFGSTRPTDPDRYMIEGAWEAAQKNSPVTSAPNDFVSGWKGFDLRLDYGYIGTATQTITHSEVLKGVHLTGRRKVVNASTSGGDLSASGQSLLEVYPFFCREVLPVIAETPT
jgi:hypothetical protein